MQLQNHSSWLFELKAVIQNVDLKFENNFGNKILTETKTSVGKHADKNSSFTTKQMIIVTISFEIQLLKVSYLHDKETKIYLQLHSWLRCKKYH